MHRRGRRSRREVRRSRRSTAARFASACSALALAALASVACTPALRSRRSPTRRAAGARRVRHAGRRLSGLGAARTDLVAGARGRGSDAVRSLAVPGRVLDDRPRTDGSCAPRGSSRSRAPTSLRGVVSFQHGTATRAERGALDAGSEQRRRGGRGVRRTRLPARRARLPRVSAPRREPHPYYHAESTANAVVDLLRASRDAVAAAGLRLARCAVPRRILAGRARDARRAARARGASRSTGSQCARPRRSPARSISRASGFRLRSRAARASRVSTSRGSRTAMPASTGCRSTR